MGLLEHEERPGLECDWREGFFRSDGIPLSCSYASPQSRKASLLPATLLIHSSASEGGRGKVLYENLQKRLAANGIASLAYDTRGVGESKGNFYDSTLQNRLTDAENALEVLFDDNSIDPKKIVIVGTSMGGYVAGRLIGKKPELKGVVLINPSAYGKHTERLRLKPFWEFSYAIRQANSWENSPVFTDLRDFPGAVMTVDSEQDDVIPKKIKDAYAAFSRIPNKLILSGIPHAFMSVDNEVSDVARRVAGMYIADFCNNLFKS